MGRGTTRSRASEGRWDGRQARGWHLYARLCYTYGDRVDEGVLEVLIPAQELPLQEVGVDDVPEDGDVDGVCRGDVLELDRFECHSV